MPFELCEDKMNDPLAEVDPDTQYYRTIPNLVSNSDYFDHDSLKTKLDDLKLDSQNFSMIGLNARSIPRNFHRIERYFELLPIKFSLVGISETWHNDSNHEFYNMCGYQKPEQLFRKDRVGGGVSIYAIDGLKYTRRYDLDVFNDHIESIYIEIEKSCINLEKNVIVGMIYRPPNRNLDDFKNSLDVTLTKIKKEGKLNYLLGDYNINLLNSDTHLPTADFLDLMYSNSYLPLINKPTRVTQQTVSLIDNIYSNCTTNIQVFKGILHTLEISDHFPVFAICPKKVVFNENKEFIYRRSLSRQNCEKFISILSEFDWDLLLREQNRQSHCFTSKSQCFTILVFQ